MKSKIILFTGILSFIMFSPLWAATYYINAAIGSDLKTGTSQAAPFRSIQKAADTMVAGDTAIVVTGIYNERVRISRSGNSTAPITYQAQGVTINHGFTIKADYINIEGFEITDTVNEWDNGAGIYLEGRNCEIKNNYLHDITRVGILIYDQDTDSLSTSECVVRNNRIERAGLAGIEVYGRNNLIEINDISHILQYPPKWTNPPSWADADGIHFFGSGHIIRKNSIHDILMSDAENINPHIDCFQTFGPAYNITFEQNYCDNPNDNMQGFMVEEMNAPVRNITVRNNIIKAFRVLNFWGCEYTVVTNNTFTSELTYSGTSGYGIELHNCPNSKVQNNIFYDVGRHAYPYLYVDSVSQTGLQVGYNCHYMSDGRPPSSSSFLPRPTDLWMVDPNFVEISSNNFSLQANSPLIDAGINLPEVTNDFDDTQRPMGSGYDIGAFEYTAGADRVSPEPPTGVEADKE
jgi:hypothetical protein